MKNLVQYTLFIAALAFAVASAPGARADVGSKKKSDFSFELSLDFPKFAQNDKITWMQPVMLSGSEDDFCSAVDQAKYMLGHDFEGRVDVSVCPGGPRSNRCVQTLREGIVLGVDIRKADAPARMPAMCKVGESPSNIPTCGGCPEKFHNQARHKWGAPNEGVVHDR